MVLQHPDLLARHAHADQHDVGLIGVDRLDHRLVLGRAGRDVEIAVMECAICASGHSLDPLGRLLGHARGAADEEDLPVLLAARSQKASRQSR
jgi:hypothetical protein